MAKKTYYKVLEENGKAFHGGKGSWDLPKDGEPGKWNTVKGELEPCFNGLHVCEKQDVVHWIGPAIFECEIDSTEIIRQEDKSVVRKARLVRRLNWDERIARLFAADCAEKSVSQWQKSSGKKCDPRTRAAIRAARDFAEGNITAAELSAAHSAAYLAADLAARSAAYSAARSAAASAARQWQTKRLFDYLDGKRG